MTEFRNLSFLLTYLWFRLKMTYLGHAKNCWATLNSKSDYCLFMVPACERKCRRNILRSVDSRRCVFGMLNTLSCKWILRLSRVAVWKTCDTENRTCWMRPTGTQFRIRFFYECRTKPTATQSGYVDGTFYDLRRRTSNMLAVIWRTEFTSWLLGVCRCDVYGDVFVFLSKQKNILRSRNRYTYFAHAES